MHLTALFNNMFTNSAVEDTSFKMHDMLLSIIPWTSQETSHRFQMLMFLSCDWWVLIHSACFCFKMTVTMIDGSIKPNRMLGFELQSLHVIERCSTKCSPNGVTLNFILTLYSVH